MDGQFAQQLANLQQAASRAGRGGPNDRRSNTVDQSSSSSSTSGGGRGGGRGGGDDARWSGDGRNNRNRYDGNNGRVDGRNNGSSSSSSYRDSPRDNRNRDGHRHHHRSRDDYDNYNNNRSPRKRGRTDSNYYDNGGGSPSPRGRDYRGRGANGRGGGRFGGGGGRWNRNGNNNNNNRRKDWNREESYGNNNNSRREVPLAELVAKAAEKHRASVDDNNETASAENGVENATKRRRHIAVLFLTIADLPHEHIWKEWLKSNNDESEDAMMMVSVLCHAKHPERIRSPWLRRRHLLRKRGNDDDEGDAPAEGGGGAPAKGFHTRRPEWGSIEITRAMIDLLEEGLRIGVNARSSREEEEEEGDDDDDGGNKNAVGRSRGDSRGRYLATPADCEPSGNDGAEGESVDPERASCVDDIPPVDRFVFASESCLPVATLDEMETALFGPRSGVTKDDERDRIASLYDRSWINARSNPNNGYARQLQWDAVRSSDVPQNSIWKADQWMALTRAHGGAIASLPSKYLDDRPLWPAFRRVRASDEMYFPTALSILGVLHRPPGGGEVTPESSAKESCAGDRVRRRRVTYCDWSVGAKNPASFARGEWREVVEKARGEGCLLARKFAGRSISSSAGSMRGGKRKIGSVNDDDGEGDGLVSVEDWVSAVVKRGS